MTSKILKSVDFTKTQQKYKYLVNETTKNSLITQRLLYDEKQFSS